MVNLNKNMKRKKIRQLNRFLKQRDYVALYYHLKSANYVYNIDAWSRDFGHADDDKQFGYLMHLLSMDYSVDNVLLICDYILYCSKYWIFDLQVRFILDHALSLYPSDRRLINTLLSTYIGNPDSPYSVQELDKYQEILNHLEEPLL